MTHLSASNNSEEDAFTKAQLAQFQAACDEIRHHYPSAKAHALNSYGIARHTGAQHEMVRLGLGLYGLGTYDGIDRLEEVLAWKCTVSQVGVLQPGETLGYSRAFKATEITHYATLPVGYADGLQRSLSLGKGAVYIRGKRCAILGNVCMDMVMVELGDLQITPSYGNTQNFYARNYHHFLDCPVMVKLPPRIVHSKYITTAVHLNFPPATIPLHLEI